MKTETQIHLFGSLRKKKEEDRDLPVRFYLDSPALLVDVLKRVGMPLDKVQLVMVNHKAVRKDCIIQPGDRIALFPKEYIVFADWKDFRF